MRNVIRVLGLIFLFSGCAQLYFTKPQPQKGITIKSFIDDIQGVYSDSTIDVEIFKNEIIVADEKYLLTTKTLGKNEVLIKYYKDFYFASFKDSSYYSVFMCKFYDNKLAIYMLNPDPQSINSLKKFIDVKTLNEEKKWYVIEPSKKEFDLIFHNEMFDVVNVLEKN